MQSVISIWTRPVRALLGMAKPTVKEIISGTPFTLFNSSVRFLLFIYLFIKFYKSNRSRERKNSEKGAKRQLLYFK